MEEKVVDGREKKYVLYTVVGEERGRAGVGVWVVRVLLGTLLLVALAVVPYLSLRLAQVSDKTLVVFQPVPVHNRSLHRHQHHVVVEHGKHVDVASALQSAALTKENYTEASNGTKAAATAAAPPPPPPPPAANGSTGGIVTLHETAVTLAVMEDTNATKKNDTSQDDDEEEEEEDSTTDSVPPTSEPPASLASATVAANSPSPAAADNATSQGATTPAPRKDDTTPVGATDPTPTPSPSSTTTKEAKPKEAASSSTPVASSTTTTSTAAATTTTTTATTTTTPASTTTRRPLAHKLAYVATTASGNHVGGFCVWKTDNAVTRWSYFYENIPIEYQSHQDSSDHEMRGMLAAVRAWAPLWKDSHVVLRSHHQSITGADHPARHALARTLEKLSEGNFTYELEWRLKKTDPVVYISFCLSRLHRNFEHWLRTFEGRVDDLIGRQDWAVAREENRKVISRDLFHTDEQRSK